MLHFVEYHAACGRRLACVDIWPSPKTDVLVLVYISLLSTHPDRQGMDISFTVCNFVN